MLIGKKIKKYGLKNTASHILIPAVIERKKKTI